MHEAVPAIPAPRRLPRRVLRPEADRLIKDAWNEIEFALRRLNPPFLRRRARELGVFYALRPGESDA